MIHLVFFLEGPSEKEMLKGLLPRLLSGDTVPQYVVFEGKKDMERELPRKLWSWRRPDCRFVVLRDKDGADCLQVKRGLVEICRQAGKPDALVRIACHELESWYLGDLNAVEQAMNMSGLAGRQGRRKYRDPDRLANPVQELERIPASAIRRSRGRGRSAVICPWRRAGHPGIGRTASESSSPACGNWRAEGPSRAAASTIGSRPDGVTMNRRSREPPDRAGAGATTGLRSDDRQAGRHPPSGRMSDL